MAVQMPATLARWKRERELSSDQRAGSWARGRAHKRHWDFFKRHWLRVSVMPLSTVALAFLTFLVPGWSRAFVAGALIATGFWIAVIIVLVGSGSASAMMGEVAEQWTAQELRPLRRRGWRLINHMLIRRHDIDHVAVGPSSIVVVETKWSSESWDLDRPSHWLGSAVRQAQDNARDVRLHLGGNLAGAPIRAVVVLWSAEPLPDRSAAIDDVAVVPGPLLRDWVASLDGVTFGPEEVDTVWRQLERHLSKRDAYELEHSEQPPPGLGEMVRHAWVILIGAIAGMLASALLLHWFGGLAGVLATATALLGLGCVALRFPKSRTAALGWIGGTQFVTVAIVGAVLFDWLR